MATTLRYKRAAARPEITFWWRDRTGALIDFSTGYTFTFKLGAVGSAAAFTKSTGITGAAGAGVEPTGTPNVTLSFTAGELAALTIGPTTWELTATSGGLARIIGGSFVLEDGIT